MVWGTRVYLEAMDNVGVCSLQIGLSLLVQDCAHNGSLTFDGREDKVGWIAILILVILSNIPQLVPTLLILNKSGYYC